MAAYLKTVNQFVLLFALLLVVPNNLRIMGLRLPELSLLSFPKH